MKTSHFISSDLSLSILLGSLRFPCLRTYFGVPEPAAISQEMRDPMPSKQLFSGTPFNISCHQKNRGLNLIFSHFSPRRRTFVEIGCCGYTWHARDDYSFPTVLHLGIGERVAWPGQCETWKNMLSQFNAWWLSHPSPKGVRHKGEAFLPNMAPMPMAPAGLPCAWSPGSSAAKENLSFSPTFWCQISAFQGASQHIFQAKKMAPKWNRGIFPKACVEAWGSSDMLYQNECQ